MTYLIHPRKLLRSVVLIGSALCAIACHGLLDVTNPTLVQDNDVANAAGANARRLDAIYHFSYNFTQISKNVAYFTDEAVYDYYGPPDNLEDYYYLGFDLHDNTVLVNMFTKNNRDEQLALLDDIFTASSLALYSMREYGRDTLKDEYLAQLFALRSFTLLEMAEDICSGFPINDITTDNRPLYSGPYTTDSATKYAVAQADSALAHGRDTTRFINFARVVKGRALLNLGQYAQAAAVVSAVPTEFTYTTDASTGNRFADFPYDIGGVGDREGGNGVPFVSANDPRVLTSYLQMRVTVPEDSLFNQLKYVDNTVPIVVASGVEARLIEAEAALHEPNPTKAFAILDTLRATVGLGAMTVPSTIDAQVDSLYKERAFWLYLTGRRLGDLRRLIRNYGRGAETVFPTGDYPLGGLRYGTATSIPFTVEVQGKNNPHITAGCTTP